MFNFQTKNQLKNKIVVLDKIIFNLDKYHNI